MFFAEVWLYVVNVLTTAQIPISATYIPSVFGSCIETLVFLYRPIQDAPVARLIDVVSGMKGRWREEMKGRMDGEGKTGKREGKKNWDGRGRIGKEGRGEMERGMMKEEGGMREVRREGRFERSGQVKESVVFMFDILQVLFMFDISLFHNRRSPRNSTANQRTRRRWIYQKNYGCSLIIYRNTAWKRYFFFLLIFVTLCGIKEAP